MAPLISKGDILNAESQETLAVGVTLLRYGKLRILQLFDAVGKDIIACTINNEDVPPIHIRQGVLGAKNTYRNIVLGIVTVTQEGRIDISFAPKYNDDTTNIENSNNSDAAVYNGNVCWYVN